MNCRVILSLSFVFAACAASGQSAHLPATEGRADTGQIYAIVDELPEPEYNMGQYLANNLHYPDSAIAHNVEGRVIIKFVVKKNGRIAQCSVLRSVEKSLDEEALRVVSSMPAWRPGKMKGRKVDVWFKQPVTFKLED